MAGASHPRLSGLRWCSTLRRQRLGHLGARRSGCPTRRWPARPPPKSPALKLKIREQLVAKHFRYLMARGRPEELTAYWMAQLHDDPAVAQRAFDEVDHRMRCANWDDMRQWRQQGIGA
jgi:hypothetical protein